MLRQSLLVFALAALPAVAHADVSYTFQVTDSKSGATSTNTVLSKDGKLRMSLSGSDSKVTADVIFLPAADEVIMLNQQRKEAVRMTRDDIEGMEKRMAAMGLGPGGTMSKEMAARMQEAMKNLPPQARAQAEKAMQQMAHRQAGAAKSEPLEYKATGRTGDYAGISCSYFDVMKGGDKAGELCAAKPKDIQGGAELVTALKNMASFFEGMTKVMGAQAPRMELKPIEGRFPILSRNFVDGEEVTETVLKSISDKPISSSEFEVPAGYKTRQLGQ